MCQRTIFSRSFIRIAEEVQLQAEEEWILEALKKIKQQRNCLQIERLQLESLKTKLKEPESSKQSKSPDYNNHVSAVNMMNPGLGNKRHNADIEGMDDDALCNEEELNLLVAKPSSSTQPTEKDPYDYDMDEEDDDDDDEEDGENLLIDINMLMNGNM